MTFTLQHKHEGTTLVKPKPAMPRFTKADKSQHIDNAWWITRDDKSEAYKLFVRVSEQEAEEYGYIFKVSGTTPKESGEQLLKFTAHT